MVLYLLSSSLPPESKQDASPTEHSRAGRAQDAPEENFLCLPKAEEGTD